MRCRHSYNKLTQQVTVIVYHLHKFCGKWGWKVNGTRLFESSQRKISGSNGTSEKIVLFFRMEYPKRKSVFMISSKPSLIPVSGLRGRFPVNGTDSYKMENAIPERNLPVLNFANQLPKPWTDRLAHVNGRQPVFVQRGLSRTSVTFIAFIAYLRSGRCLKHWIMPT